MENWQVAVLTIGAVVAGMLVPVLLQLHAAARNLNEAVRETSKRLLPALDDAKAVTARLRKITEGMGGSEQAVGELLRTAGELARTIDQLRASAQSAATIATVVTAGVRAFQDFRREAASADERGAPVQPASVAPAVEEAMRASIQHKEMTS